MRLARRHSSAAVVIALMVSVAAPAAFGGVLVSAAATTPRPDLIVSSVTGSPATVDRGALLSLSAKVTNQGNAGANASTLGWYLKAADGTRRLVASAAVPSLAKGT